MVINTNAAQPYYVLEFRLYVNRTSAEESITPLKAYFTPSDGDFIFEVGRVGLIADLEGDDDILVHEDILYLQNDTDKKPGSVDLTASILFIPPDPQHSDTVTIDYSFEYRSKYIYTGSSKAA